MNEQDLVWILTEPDNHNQVHSDWIIDEFWVLSDTHNHNQVAATGEGGQR
jgi:hypothetical protein